MGSRNLGGARTTLRRNAVAQACVTFSMMLVAGAANAAAGFGDTNDATGAPARIQTYYAHSPSGQRAAIPPEANSLIPGYTGDTGKALRKFVDNLPQVNSVTNTLSDGITKKYIPAAVPVAWVNPAGVTTTDDYYEIAVVQYKEKMHSDLKPTTVRGYVQIDHLASNNLGQIKGSKKFPLMYPDGKTPIMIPGTDANGKLTGGMVQALAVDEPHYLGPVISAVRNVPTRLKFHNLLPVGRYSPTGGRNGDLFVPVDETLAGAGVGPDGVTRYTQNRAEIHLHGGDTPWISDGTPHQWIAPAAERDLLAKELAAAGSPLKPDDFLRGPGASNVPDMNEPGDGAVTYYFPNRQSARLMWYHDHTYGLTRLNVYVGEVAPYVLKDSQQDAKLAAVSGFPNDIIHLVIQDKTFVPADIKLQDGRWNAKVVNDKNVPLAGAPLWGEEGDLWYPHVYEVNQDPSNGVDGTNPVGRWDWGPYFWPVFPAKYNLPKGSVDDVTLTPEAWMDTPVVNGVAYPTLTVEPRAQRFQILNGSNDRFWNLSFFLADSAVSEVPVITKGSGYKSATVTLTGGTGTGATAEVVLSADGAVDAIRVTNPGTGYAVGDVVTATLVGDGNGSGATLGNATIADGTEVKMVPAAPLAATGLQACATDANGVDLAPPYAAACWPSNWPTDGRAGGVPDPRTAGPKIYQIGTEGGLLPQVAEIAAAPMQYEYNRRSVTVLNTFTHSLFMGNAERADIVVDFSGYEGKTLILYSDAPAPVPAFDPRNDHWTGKPDETGVGSVDTPKAGFGPNTRTVMQIKVANSAAAAQAKLATAQANLVSAQNKETLAIAAAQTASDAAATAKTKLDAATAQVTATLNAYMAVVTQFAAATFDTPTYWLSLAVLANDALAYNAAKDAAAAAQIIYDTATANAASAAAAAARATQDVVNAQVAVNAAQAAANLMAGGQAYTPLAVDGLKAALPAVYGNTLVGQEPPIVAQSVYNSAFGKTWSDAPVLSGPQAGTKAFATIFTGTLQEPSFRFVPGTPNDSFDKLVLSDGGSGYVTAPVPVISPPVDANGTPLVDGVRATAATTLRIKTVNMLSPGAGYLFAPVVTFGNTSAGTGAAAVARMQVSKVNIANGGTGFTASTPFPVIFSAPDSRVANAVQATGNALVNAQGVITGVEITNPGSGYAMSPLVSFANGTGTGASATTELNIQSIDLVSNDPNHPEFAGGAGYDNLNNVTVRITPPTAKTGAVAAVASVTGAVADITLTNVGRGYLAAPTVNIPFPKDVFGVDVIGGVAAVATAATGGGSILVKNKAIQELFDPTYGRMNATLGIEIPFTSALTQTTIPLGYVDPVTEQFQDGETQIWKITHNGVDAHPVHFHLLNVQLINRIGWDGTIKPPAANEYGWKETIRMNPLEDIVVAVRAKKPVLPGFGLPNSNRLMDPSQPQGVPMGFTQVDVVTGNPAVVTNELTDLGWEYVWHCHILGHEENDFMRPVKFSANELAAAAPASLTASQTGATVNLNWSDVATTEYQYRVTRYAISAPDGKSAAAPAVKLPANSMAFADTPTPAIGGTLLTYTYKVEAVGQNGSGSALVAVPVTVTPPTLTSVAASSTSVARVSWTDMSVNETQFTVEQAPAITGPWTVSNTVNGISSANVTGTGKTYQANAADLVGGRQYFFRVSANLASDQGVLATSPSAVLSYTEPLITPAAPTGLNFVFNAGGTQMSATFTDKSYSETEFDLTAPSGAVLASAPSTTQTSINTKYTTPVDLTSLAVGSNYVLSLVAKDVPNSLTSAAVTRTLNMTTVPATGGGNVSAAVNGTDRDLTVQGTAFTLPTTANTTYMPVVSYDVTYCQVSATTQLGAAAISCPVGSNSVNLAVGATKLLNLGARLTGNNYWKYEVKARNAVGVSTGTKTAASR